MSGTALSQFNDFTLATTSVKVSGPESLVNDAQLNTYSFGDLMGGDTGRKKMIQGGKTITENVVFQDNGTFRFTLPGETQTWSNPQKLVQSEYHWRFSLAHMSWTRQEVLLNDRIKYGTEENRFLAFVDLRNEKELLMWTAKWNGVEAQLWAEPDSGAMEAAGGKQAMSIPVYVNEDTNGLFNNLDGSATTFTTVGGINPTTTTQGQTAWVPQTKTYTQEISAQDHMYNPGNLLAGISALYRECRFEQPPTMQSYFDDPRFNRFKIFTSTVGETAAEIAVRMSNDLLRGGWGPQDWGYGNPAYRGIPIKRVSTLDTATLYENSNTTDKVAESTADNIGPRYYLINSQYLYPVFHDEMYFEKDEISRHHNDPDTFVCPVATWYNVICTSRRRQGLLSPSGDLYSELYT